jgi:hypothetical protein
MCHLCNEVFCYKGGSKNVYRFIIRDAELFETSNAVDIHDRGL